jgi:arylsulfatase
MAKWSRRRRWTADAAAPALERTFDIGADTGTPVDDNDYQIPFKFTGKIGKLTIALDPPKLTPEDEKKLEDAYRLAQDAK